MMQSRLNDVPFTARLGLWTVLMLIGMTARAESWYQVEVIVFDYLKPDLDGELWFENPGLPPLDYTVELVLARPEDSAANPVATPPPVQIPAATARVEPPKPPPVPYRMLPLERYRLREDLRRLQLSSAYRPLLHVAWMQPGLGTARARSVHLSRRAGEAVTPAPDPEPTDATEAAGGADILPPPAPIVDGLVRLRDTNVLLLDVDFAYFPQDFARILALQPGVGEGAVDERLLDSLADYVRLSESKRVLLNELNYFDHPLFGVLVQISRINPVELYPENTLPDEAGTLQPIRAE
jgi:hypothetical protein